MIGLAFLWWLLGGVWWGVCQLLAVLKGAAALAWAIRTAAVLVAMVVRPKPEA